MDETVEEEVVEEVKEEIVQVEPVAAANDAQLQREKNVRRLADASTSAIMNLQTSSSSTSTAVPFEETVSKNDLLEIPDLTAVDLSFSGGSGDNSHDLSSIDVASLLQPASSTADTQMMHLSFNDKDLVQNPDKTVVEIDAPKTIERLEQISEMRHQQSKLDGAGGDGDDDDDNYRIRISNEVVNLDGVNFKTLDGTSSVSASSSSAADLLGHIEEL